MTSWNYVATAQKPTIVSHSLVGNFTGPQDLNLIVSKCTRIEIHKVDNDGLQCMLDVPLYGRIATMKLWRPAGYHQDMMCVSHTPLLHMLAASGVEPNSAKRIVLSSLPIVCSIELASDCV